MSKEQLTNISSAHYSWREAVRTDSDARAKQAKLITVLPSVDQMPTDSPFLGPVKDALAPLELAAAYVAGALELENIETRAKSNQPFRSFTLNGVFANSSYFAVVGAIGHEFQHAYQVKDDTPGKVGAPLQETFARELDAYAREAQDLDAVARYLKSSPKIDPQFRAANLDAWLTDLAGKIYSAG